MRFPATGLVILGLGIGALPAGIAAQTATASGALGGGSIDRQPAAVASAELDVDIGSELSIGLAARFRLVDGALIDSDWDEASDAGRVLRYFTWARKLGDDASFAIAAGHLGDVTIGHGTIVSGYASGIDFDRGRAGAELRARVGPGDIHVVVDDIVLAEIIAGRVAAPITANRRLTLAVSGVSDRSRDVALVTADASLELSHRWARTIVYADLASHLGAGAGVHLGGEITVPTARATLGARAEFRQSQAGYIPGWVSPMYLRDRDQLGDAMDAPSIGEHARDRGVGGGSGMVAIAAATDRGRLDARFATRPGLPWQASARLRLPSFRAFQLGGWLVYEASGASATAAELRAQLPRSLFFRAELGRQYTREAERWRPMWLATASIGAILGE